MDVKCCSCCKLELPKHQFYADKRSKDGLTAGCKKCHAEKAGKVYGGIRNKDIEVPDGYKRCSMCQEILPLERFSVSKNKKSGYQSHCKECRRRTRGPAKSVEILPAGTKRCWDCREILEANEDHFAKSRSSKDGLQGRCKKCSVAYRQRNRDRILKQKKEHYRLNRETIRKKQSDAYYEKHDEFRAKAKEYYVQNRLRIRQQQAEYRLRTLEQRNAYRQSRREWYLQYNRQYYQNNKERESLRKKQWHASHPENGRLNEQKRRLRKRNLIHQFSIEQWQFCLDYWNYKCAICGREDNLHADHWIPISSSSCPGTIIDNIIVLCISCNSSKHNKNPVEWLFEKLDDHEARLMLNEIEAYFEYARAFTNKEE